mmetsp:Transcript_34273/g.50869  ORF Transcript_34273/g.50869 Transcript_34273/m.50869 type:complete len:148 (-) Transcript_34273:439-882(-)
MLVAERDDPGSKIVCRKPDQGYLESIERSMNLYVPRLRDYNVRPVAFVDGVCFRIANKWSNRDAQREDYSGEKKYVDPTGTLVAACWNCPGKLYDSTCARKAGLSRTISGLPEGWCVVGDQGFTGRVRNSMWRIVRILGDGEYLPSE